MTAYDRVESIPHAKLSDAVGLIPHPEDISARVSLALQQIQDPTDESLRQSTTLLIETVEQILGTVTAQQATIASLEARLEILERLAATSADAMKEKLELVADLGVRRCDGPHDPSRNDRH
ncbi:MAG: hypothetical protein JWP89_1900 [Schlesneria sp.]|nr:hypothetical protein [Schlesneria sp.]